MEELKKDPTFVEQAFALIEENYPQDGKGYGMAISDHKLLVKILDTHEKYVDCKNSEFANTLIEDVNEVIKDQWIRVLVEKLDDQSDKLNKTMDLIAKDILKIKERLNNAEERNKIEDARIDRVEKRLDIKKERIRKLEEQMLILQPETIREYTDEIRELKPYIERWGRFFAWWTWRNWWKIAMIIISILATFIGLNFYMHHAGWVTQNQKTVKYTPEEELRIYNAPTRAVHGPDLSKLTNAQRDSIHEANEQEIEKTIRR